MQDMKDLKENLVKQSKHILKKKSADTTAGLRAIKTHIKS